MNNEQLISKKLLLSFFIGLLLIWAIGNIPSILNFKVLYTHADWKLSQYNVNYFDHGFVRRGLVGTILFPIMHNSVNNTEFQKLFIFWKETFLFFIYGFLFCIFIFKKTAPQSNWLKFSLLSCLFLSPCGLIQAAYDFGRYDHINFILLAIILFLIDRKKFKIISYLLAIAVLVHENSIFYIHPLVTAISFQNIRVDLKNIFKLNFPSIVTASLVFLFGNGTVDLPEQLSKGAMVWGEGLQAYIFKAWSEKGFDVIIFFAYIFIITLILFYFYKRNRLNIDLKIISCFSPLILLIIASDWGRWVHYIFINFMIVICYKISISRKIIVGNFFYILLSFLTLPFGPIGIGGSLPYLTLIFEKFN